MRNLYEKNCEEDLIKLQDKIKEKINTINFTDEEEKRLRHNVKRHQNLLRYQNGRHNELLSKKVNAWFIENIDYLDSSKTDFKNSFTSNYGESVFELAMADFVKANFFPKKKEKYEMECLI